MFPEDQQLAVKCREMAEVIKSARQWVRRNQELVGPTAAPLGRDLKRSIRRCNKFAVAAQRKMCVGVFGPSQAGKSYLISALARGQDGQLIADFQGQRHDFISEINPAGDKESTGLVTRFTLTRPEVPDQEYPVTLKMLSETDLVKILGNTYFSDFKHKQEPDAEAITQKVAKLAQRRTDSRTSNLSEDDLADLRDYFWNNYEGNARIQVLQKVYWDNAIALAPLLTPADRAELFGLIWDSVQPFNELFLTLLTALQKLGMASHAYCGIDALIPREESIIDVATLKGLGATGGELMVVGAEGQKATLPRSLVTALISELTVTMAEKPDDFFDYTDLLDFPGYRSRLTHDVQALLSEAVPVSDYFLRGKVSYLFQQYHQEHELTSMILAIGPSNQDVQDLPEVVNQWVESTHGATPEKRTDQLVSLFLVLTKFDLDFAEKKGAENNEESRWSTRLEASFLGYLGQGYSWPTKWDKRGPFRNVFLLRNPNVMSKDLFDYDQKTEIGVRADQSAYVDRLKQGFLRNEQVRNHLKEPAASWEAVMQLNDGGISFLRDHLRPMCSPDLKRGQIHRGLLDEAETVHLKLAPMFRSDDLEHEREKKSQWAMHLGKLLARCASQLLLGKLIRSMQVQERDLYDLYFRMDDLGLPSEGEEASDDVVNEGAIATPIGTSSSTDEIWDGLFGEESQPAASQTNNGKTPRKPMAHHDATERYSSQVQDFWISKMSGLAEDNRYCERFNFPRDDVSKMVHELTDGAGRLGLWQDLTGTLRQEARYKNLRRDRLAWKQVSQATRIINDYLDWLGHDPRRTASSKRRVEFMGRQRDVFQPVPPIESLPQLPPEQTAFTTVYFQDWIFSLCNLIVENVGSDGGNTLDPVENGRLGELLADIQCIPA